MLTLCSLPVKIWTLGHFSGTSRLQALTCPKGLHPEGLEPHQFEHQQLCSLFPQEGLAVFPKVNSHVLCCVLSNLTD
jgi:hypothetical protein